VPLKYTRVQLGGSMPLSTARTYIYMQKTLRANEVVNTLRQLVPYVPLRAFTGYGMNDFQLSTCMFQQAKA